jgi:hypothetical protein
VAPYRVRLWSLCYDEVVLVKFQSHARSHPS